MSTTSRPAPPHAPDPRAERLRAACLTLAAHAAAARARGEASLTLPSDHWTFRELAAVAAREFPGAGAEEPARPPAPPAPPARSMAIVEGP